MILHGNSRGGAGSLADHLTNEIDNDHVELHELRGFVSENLHGALNEGYALSLGTRACTKFMYSLSLNPPPHEDVKTSDFEEAIDKVEQRLGLEGTSRAIVFHEKNGRRHGHVVWIRVDPQEMKAVQLSFDRKKLKSVSRELFIEHGWKMPRGLADGAERNPTNFDLSTWQQSKRMNRNPKAIKRAFQDAFAISDSKAAFIHAMHERGFKVAQGDRRGFVAIDVAHGEVFSIPRMTGQKTKAIRALLGDESALPSVSEAKRQIADEMLPKVEDLQQKLEAQNQKLRRDFAKKREALVLKQRKARQALQEKIEARQTKEAKVRQDRFRKGIRGLWDRLRGEHKRIVERNTSEAQKALKRDQKELDGLVFKQLAQRNQLNVLRMEAKESIISRQTELARDVNLFRGMKIKRDETPNRGQERQPGKSRGPTFDP